jgi:hypothetical protein
MHRSRVFVPLASAVAFALGWLLLRLMLGREVRPLEAVVLAAACVAAVLWWRASRARHARQQAESMRDSALW